MAPDPDDTHNPDDPNTAQTIAISGGGATAVATDSILESGRALAVVAQQAREWSQGLESAAASGSAAAAAGRHHATAAYVSSAARAVSDAGIRAADLRDKLNRAAEAYGWAERTAEQAMEAGGALIGYGLGFAAPLIGWLLLGAVPSTAIALGASSLITGSPRNTVSMLGAWALAHRGALRNPAVVTLVRQAVSAADDGMLGFAHVPYPLARALDDRESGVFGVHGAASTVIALAGPHALKETPVVVTNVASASAAAPGGFYDLASRIPPNGAGDPQVRIERYNTGSGRPRWVVYTGGTIDEGFVAGTEPWDDTSNLQGVAELDPASVRAARDALQAAGAQPGDAVLPVGYSQGGIVATDLAANGGFQTPELVTFGSPTGQMDVPAGVTNVAVEHRDDIIPALGGDPRPADRGGLDRILVQRTTYDTPPALEESPLEAHHIGVYAQTAAQMDRSTDPRLLDARSTLDDFTRGAPAEVTFWRADRVSADPVSADRVSAAG